MRFLTCMAVLLAVACTEKAKIHFETATVERGSIIAKVTASGTLSALVTVQVGSQVSGRVKDILVDYNAVVSRGQVIARIDPQLFEATREQARANYAAAKAEVTKARIQAAEASRQQQRAAGLFERKLIAEAERDTAQATADGAAAQVDAANGHLAQALATLHQSEVNLQYTHIVSPINGVVISRNVDVGQTVAASLQAPTLFVLAEDLRKMQVNTSVAEADIGRLDAGMPVLFTVDAYAGERFTGTVRQIRNAPQTVQNVVTYDAVIDVDNPDLKLRPGMTTTVTFIYAQKDDVLRVPNAALRFRPPQDVLARQKDDHPKGEAPNRVSDTTMGTGPDDRLRDTTDGTAVAPKSTRWIWLMRADAPTRVAIETGISDGALTEIAKGDVQAGDMVITDAVGATGTFRPPGAFGRR
ncbi:MAG: efflux transporter periplasmic adaptor subunit [Deltaproteobacteria bacterium RIFOXYA12_FULL_58_15]|nr:MAG: efflux transporter periplasmic adaptor subunit [Deltaproteobacteria bacterium RIFOXYA12_FULL_58_15]OGR10750.1 MAG: efflux transporter periplasmic adaptor subunit [Deltaproteobacteria bacterium RIFOXYB12_FULL_58_9]